MIHWEITRTDPGSGLIGTHYGIEFTVDDACLAVAKASRKALNATDAEVNRGLHIRIADHVVSLDGIRDPLVSIEDLASRLTASLTAKEDASRPPIPKREPLKPFPTNPQPNDTIEPRRFQVGTVEVAGLIVIMEEGQPYWPEIVTNPDGTSVPAVGEDTIAILTRNQYGEASIQAISLTCPPPSRHTGWEEFYEAQIDSPDGETYLWPGGGPSSENPFTDPVTVDGPGRYHFRIYISGRIGNVGVSNPTVPERYLIETWKATADDH
ncbi:hypothetical protein B2J88_40780 [Rhodococcus sp. SRB_17]|uniref:hypothetical protein n=1 Tax=Rhodococcus sp. OK302 TaxID=1882769 RepID=UPI000B9420F3|nr:hypothetical protein [Rhodococcus sp. OK302]NMM90600.1 hypothetical protein [Rhodococcus sp. SRB_17]OYD70610.1 hypothetical protein BDB13_4239 [Rhodococcus sp. OK302]